MGGEFDLLVRGTPVRMEPVTSYSALEALYPEFLRAAHPQGGEDWARRLAMPDGLVNGFVTY